MSTIRIFISSVQGEFAQERKALRDFLRKDPLTHRFFDVFLFEDVPALDRRPDSLYLDEVKHSDIYVGLFGNDYGSEDADRISPIAVDSNNRRVFAGCFRELQGERKHAHHS